MRLEDLDATDAREVTRDEDEDAWRLAAEACEALGVPEFSRVWVERSDADGSNPLETIYAI